MMKQSTVIKKLKEKFPDISGIKDGYDWGGSEGSIHLGDSAEGGLIDGLPAADYYNEFNAKIYDHEFSFGVHEKLAKFLDKCGYNTEWWDPGTILAYKK